MSLTSHSHTHTLTRTQNPTLALTRACAQGPGADRSDRAPIRLAREGATGSSGKYWVGLGWRREIISEPCSRYPKTKHTLGEKATVVMYQSQVPMRLAPCTCRGPATSTRYPMGPASVHPAVPRTWQYVHQQRPVPLLSCPGGGGASEHGGDPAQSGRRFAL